MTIVNTNVISELVKPSPSEKVALWVESQPKTQLFTTSVTEAGMLMGIELMRLGKRQQALRAAVEKILGTSFAGRILPFDSQAARFYAEIAASRRKGGRTIKELDCQIAAIARAHGYAVATRNTDDFQDGGVTVINPWET